MSTALKIAVLLSGGGTTLANLLKWSDEGRLQAEVGLVVSSRAGVRGLHIAEKAGIPTAVVPSKKYRISAREAEEITDWRAMSGDIDKVLLPGGFDLICMAGFMCCYIIPRQYQGRVINIHPSLIPMFCGQGMYGQRVHEAVVAAGVRVTGCTVHFADRHYDTGPIILQRACPVYSGDDPSDVAARVFAEECIAYPTAINLIAEGRVRFAGNRTYVDGDHLIERFPPDDA